MLAIVTRRSSLLARLSATMEDTADRKVFDTDGYLATRYGDMTVKDRLQFLLDGHHEVFQSLPYSLKVLDFGSGPVIQHCISAAPHASEIVFSDIAESNREAVRKWLRRDPTAFNWSPHFDYVVQTLEGKGEKEAREREEMLRKVVKGVVHCDVLADPPIEKGFEGPYDVLLEGGVLNMACTTAEGFKKGVVRLSHLLKSGGTIITWGADIVMSQSAILFTVRDNEYNLLCLEKEFVADAVKEAGFCDVHTKWCEVDQSNAIKFNTAIGSPEMRGYYVIHAKKI